MKRRPQSIPGLLLAVLRIYLPRLRAPRAALLALGVLALFGAGRWVAGGGFCGARRNADARAVFAARAARLDAIARRWPGLGRALRPDDAVRPAASASFAPTVAWNGSEYGVAWVDVRDGNGTEVYFARVSATGARVGAETRVTRRDSLKVTPHLVWGGREWAVVWTDVADEAIEVYFARIGSDGRGVGQPVHVSRVEGLDLLPRAAWTGRAYGVAWYHITPEADSINIQFAQLNAQGEPTNAAHVVRDQVVPTGTLDLGANDGRYGIAFSYFDVSRGNGVTALQRVEPDGRAGALVEVARARAVNGAAATTWNGQVYGLLWQDDQDDDGEVSMPCFATVASTGVEVRRTPLLRNHAHVTGVQLAWSGSEYAAAWTGERQGGRNDVFLTRVARTGAPQGVPLRVSATSADAMAPSVAWSGHEYGVAWHDTRERGTVAIYFARVTSQGVKVGNDARISGN